MKICLRITFYLIASLQISCSNNDVESLRVAVAANVQFAMKEIVTEFNKEFDTKIELIISSSGKLTAQIDQGAPFDIFLSANEKYPNHIVKENLALNAPKVYAQGKLVIISKDSLNSINYLTKKNVKKIAVANPTTAPYGVATIEAFENAVIMNDVEEKIVYGESISQVNQYIFSNSVDAAVTALSVIHKKDLMDGYSWYEIPDSLYKTIKQAVVKIKRDNQNIEKIDEFYNFIFSDKAKSIFEKYGYKVD